MHHLAFTNYHIALLVQKGILDGPHNEEMHIEAMPS